MYLGIITVLHFTLVFTMLQVPMDKPPQIICRTLGCYNERSKTLTIVRFFPLDNVHLFTHNQPFRRAENAKCKVQASFIT